MLDNDMFEKCLKRNPEAWDTFISYSKKIVLRSIKHELRHLRIYLPSQEIEDITQDIFFLLWEKNRLEKLTAPDTLEAWLSITSINFTFNYCRKHHFNKSKNTFSLDTISSDDPSEHFPVTMPNAVIPTTIEENDYITRIEQEISKLPDKQRLAIRFHVFDGLTRNEISSLMNLPRNTVGTILNRVKKILKKKLGDAFFRDLKGF